MKLIRYGAKHSERPGLVDSDGNIRDLGGRVQLGPADLFDLESIQRLRGVDPASLPKVDGSQRIGPCVASPSKMIGVGLNYIQHAAEAGMPLPTEPVLFSKATSSLSGPHDDIVLARYTSKTDWEVELAVVIGRVARDVPERDALDYVAGYAVFNDVSDRALQLEGTGQWLKGKSLDSFGPLGPWLVTSDEIPDPQRLSMWLDVNGTRQQESSTADMVFPVSFLVSYISRHMTLVPGDVIATGTPHGVGMGKTPPRYLKDGDRVDLGVEGLGRQSQFVRRVGVTS